MREQILQVVAMIFKRGTLDKSTEGCGDLLKSVSQLLHSGDKDMVRISFHRQNIHTIPVILNKRRPFDEFLQNLRLKLIIFPFLVISSFTQFIIIEGNKVGNVGGTCCFIIF